MRQRCRLGAGRLSRQLLRLLLLAAPLAGHAQESGVALQVNAFAGASNLPIWIAQRQGLFERRGITVTLSSPKGSLDQFKGLLEGRYPVIVTAFDNVLAYHSGQGAAEIGAIPDLVATMGIDRGLLTLMASPGIDKVAALKGQTLAVDAFSTGFSFALEDILMQAGLDRSAVSFIAVGSSDGRWKAMQDGRAQAALLTLPADLEARDHASQALTTIGASFGHYLGNVAAVRQGWAAQHRAELDAFLRGTADGMAWLRVAEHRGRAIEILHAEMPGLSPDNLDRVYQALLDPKQGLIGGGALDPKGAQTVRALRAKYADAPPPLQPLSAYLDPHYLAEASRLRTPAVTR